MNQDKQVIIKIGKLIGRQKSLFFVMLVLALITVVTTLYIPVLIGQGIDCIIGSGAVDFGKMLLILLRMAVVTGITAVSQWFMSLCNNRITYRIVNQVRTEAFGHLKTLPVKYIDSHPHGDIVSRMVADIDQFSDGLLMGFTQFFTGVMTIIGTLLFMLSIDVKITLVVVVITPVSLLVANYIAKKTFTMFRMQSQARGEITGFMNEMIGNQRIVKAFSYENEAMERFDVMNDLLGKYSLKAIFFSSINNPATRFVNGLVYAGVGIFGAFSAIRGYLTIGQLTSFLSYANQYTKPFNEISGVITELQNALACAGRVFALLEEPSFQPDAEGAEVLQKADGSVRVEDLAFSYQPETRLIQNLNLDVKNGQRIAIVGPTGCGKSTVINLLMRFYEPDGGNIYVSGRNVLDITKNSLRANYGMVLQETWLKAGTVRENIAYGKPEASLEEVEKAAKDAHAHSFIKRMPEGYDTVLTEDGGNLSQGQRQLLCIARVMLTLPPMLILDEATSSIDTRTELKIQDAFTRMMEGRTSFIVAHRLSTIQEADVILVMKDGNIIEQGTHGELLEKRGFYCHLYESQFAVS